MPLLLRAPSRSTTSTPLVRLALGVEESEALDGAVEALTPVADALLADPRRADALHGTWLGHALHPLMTFLPLGSWTSAHLLDALGGEDARPAAQRLVGIGLLSAVPTAVTGLAEWGVLGQRDRRTGVAHAGLNGVALGCYAASWLARRRGNHRRGARVALGGAAATVASGFLGGHLTEARKVSTRHPAFADD